MCSPSAFAPLEVNTKQVNTGLGYQVTVVIAYHVALLVITCMIFYDCFGRRVAPTTQVP